MQDLEYKKFHSKLIPTVSHELVIGVRTPQLRKFSKEFSKTEESKIFLASLPHKYYEENNVHAFVIEQIKDYETALYETEQFLPFIDNWATCDMFQPKIFRKNKEKLIVNIRKWIQSDSTYTVRYGINQLMNLYSDDDFSPEFPELVAGIKSDEYYINMMRAWYFATALSKQYSTCIKYIEEKKLDKWTHNKTIQKAIESYRIDKEIKNYLRTLKVK